MIDVHAHVLPCDHGCESAEMALQQIRMAQNYNIRTIIATPHFDCRIENVESFLKRRNLALQSVLSLFQKSDSVQIIPAAEISLEPGIESLPNLEQLSIGSGRYLLVEISKDMHGDWSYEALFELERRGFRPIIAHIHRYDSHTQQRLIDLNFYAQINIESKTNKNDWAKVRSWIANRQVHFIGSDIHGLDTRIYRDFQVFYKKLNVEDQIRFSQNATHLIQ